MCLSAHNYLTFGLSRHIITRVLDQSTLKNLRSESARTFTDLHDHTHDLLAHNYLRFGSIQNCLYQPVNISKRTSQQLGLFVTFLSQV